MALRAAESDEDALSDERGINNLGRVFNGVVNDELEVQYAGCSVVRSRNSGDGAYDMAQSMERGDVTARRLALLIEQTLAVNLAGWFSN
jgi:hypothetical protein